MFVGCNLNVSQHRHVEIAQKGCQCIYQYVRPTDVPNFTCRSFGFLFNVVKLQAKKMCASAVKYFISCLQKILLKKFAPSSNI